MARDEGFLARWSRLKQSKLVGADDVRSPSSAPPASVSKDQPMEDQPDDGPQANLPSVESLTKDSDFSLFMRAGVPDVLRNRALRKLWEADPSLYAHDGLTDYGQDFAKIMRDGEKLAETAYKVGRGFLEKDELPWEKEEAEKLTAQAKDPVQEGRRDAEAQRPALEAPEAVEPIAEIGTEGEDATENGEKPAIAPKNLG